MSPRRTFTAAEDALIRRAHAGEIHMHDLARQLGAGFGAIYRRMEEMDLRLRKPDPRSIWRRAA